MSQNEQTFDSHKKSEDITCSSLEQSLSEKFNITRTVLICVLIATGGLINGYDTGSISGIVNMPKFAEAVGNKVINYNPDSPKYEIKSWKSGIIVAGVSFGGLFGSLVFGKVSDKWGRRISLIICTSLISIATMIQGAGHKHWPVILIGRIISGISIGGISAVCPMYLSETSPAQLRAILVSMFQVLMTVGILIGEIVSLSSSYWKDSIGQYFVPLFLICAFSLIVLFGCVVILPESARYLISKGDIRGAKNSLSRITGLNTQNPVIQHEINDIQQSIEESKKDGEANWNEIFTFKNRVLYRVFLGISIMSLQQLSGINYFFYYGTSLFGDISNINPFATSIILGAVNVIGTIMCLPVIAKFPRRTVLMTGSVVMFIAFILFACLGSFALANSNGTVNPKVGSGMIFLTCVFIVGFAGTWAPVSFVVISEMFPQRIRSKGISLGVASNWLVNTVITIVSPIATKAIGYKYGFVFSFFTFISFFVVYFFVYETRGYTLEEIEEMFASGISARQSPSWISQKERVQDIVIEHSYINTLSNRLN